MGTCTRGTNQLILSFLHYDQFHIVSYLYLKLCINKQKYVYNLLRSNWFLIPYQQSPCHFTVLWKRSASAFE